MRRPADIWKLSKATVTEDDTKAFQFCERLSEKCFLEYIRTLVVGLQLHPEPGVASAACRWEFHQPYTSPAKLACQKRAVAFKRQVQGLTTSAAYSR